MRASCRSAGTSQGWSGWSTYCRRLPGVEFITPVCIVSGWYDGFAAFVLAGYCVITAILYHDFWKYRRFWSPSSEGYPHLWDFLKNFGLVGGLVLIVLDGDPAPGIAPAANDIAGSSGAH